jgi:hypothetical protein
VELRAENQDLWVVELKGSGTDWSARQINGNAFYNHAADGIRAWVQKDRGTACATAEAYSKGTFKCEKPSVPEYVVYADLTSDPVHARPNALQGFELQGMTQTPQGPLPGGSSLLQPKICNPKKTPTGKKNHFFIGKHLV